MPQNAVAHDTLSLSQTKITMKRINSSYNNCFIYTAFWISPPSFETELDSSVSYFNIYNNTARDTNCFVIRNEQSNNEFSFMNVIFNHVTNILCTSDGHTTFRGCAFLKNNAQTLFNGGNGGIDIINCSIDVNGNDFSENILGNVDTSSMYPLSSFFSVMMEFKSTELCKAVVIEKRIVCATMQSQNKRNFRLFLFIILQYS